MRTLILAVLFGLFPTAVMAAPSSNPCVVTTQSNLTKLTDCGEDQRKEVRSALVDISLKPSTPSAARSLELMAEREYSVINHICKGGSIRAPKALVMSCYRRVGEGQRLVLQNAISNLADINACKSIKKLGKMIDCMIDQDNRLLVPLIESTLDAHEAYMRALKVMINHGCSIKGGELKCANGTGLVLAALFMFLLGRIRPQLRVVIGVTALLAGVVIANNADAAVTCQKAVTIISAKEKVAPAVAIVLLEGCNLSTEGSVKDLWNRSTILERAAKRIIASAERYCEDSSVRGVGVVKCFADINQLAKIAEGKSLRASNLWLAAREQADAEKKAEAKALQKAEIKALLNAGDKQVEEAKELIKAMEGLVVEEGSCGGLVFLFLFYFLLARLEGNRCVSVVVLAAMGCLVASFADAAICTSMEKDVNKVAAQYGLKLYDCKEVSQASKDAVYSVIYRGYVAQKGSLSEEYIRSRWVRAEGAFWSVWGGAPLWQAKIAAAICAKETLCGVTVKFSEWETHRFESPRNSNGTVDCGITQINSNSTSYSCSQLQNLETAFKEQRRIIKLKVRNSNRKDVWEKRIHRYNGSGTKAQKYARLIMSWAK